MSEDLREALLEEESYDDPLINALDNNHTTNHSPNHSHTNDSHVINTPESAIRRFVPSMATRAWVTVTVLTAVNLVNYMDRFSVAGVLPAIESFYHISESQSGLLTTSFILSYMCVSLLFGYLGDRFNRKLMLVMGIVFWGTVSLASSFIGPEHFYTFLLLRALIGVGEASYSTIAPTIMADLFAGAARTRALSFFYFAIPVGGGLGYIVASKVAEFMGSWQWALRVTPVLCLLLSLCVLLLVYEPSRGASDHSSYLQSSPWKQDVLYLLKHKSFMLITLAFTCVSFVTGALALWTPKYLYLSILVQAHTANSANVASIFGVITCTSGVIGVLAGTCVAGFLRRYTTCCDPLVCAFGLVASAPFLFMALYLAPFNTPLTYVLIFVSETLLFLNWALVSDMLMYVVLPTRRSAAASLQILMSHALGDAGSPPLIGMISDALNTAPKDYRALDHMSNLKSLQSALYINCFVAVLGGAFFLLASFHVHHDRQTTLKLIREFQLIVDKAENITELMQDPSKEDEKVQNEIRTKAVDLCKKGQISLHQMQLFFPTEMLKRFCEVKVEKAVKSYDGGRIEIARTVAATTAPDEMLKSSCEIKIEKDEDTDEKKMLKVLKSVAATTVPDGLVLKCSDLDKALAGIFSHKEVKKGTIFGAYIGVRVHDRQDAYKNGYCWDIYENNKFHHCLDARNPSESNWMRYVNPTDSSELQNLEAFQRGYQVYFRAIKDIAAGKELLVWYSLQYNQDCHQCIPTLVLTSGKTLENIILTINSSRCDICAKIFSSKYYLENHKRIHTGEKPFKCDICDKAFTNGSYLTTHKQIHSGKKTFKCGICDKAYAQRTSLAVHKRIHTAQKPLKCDVCDQTFYTKSILTIHKCMHTGEKPFKCDICDKAFTNVSHLNYHKRTHTREKLHKCDICGKAFFYASRLNEHKGVHTGERPFKCDICTQTFLQNYRLSRHKLIHSGERPFKCHICDKTFIRLDYLSLHKLSHSEKLVECDICDKSFRGKGNLSRHKSTHSGSKKPAHKTSEPS